MIIDKETKLYLDNRIKSNFTEHHSLSPEKLRQERLFQLQKDNLVGPDLEQVLDINVGEKTRDKIKLRVYVPSRRINNSKSPVIIFFHGGGFVMGNLDTHDYPCRCISKFSNLPVIAVDYKLAPEHKFPNALNDAKFVLKHIGKFPLPFSVDKDNILVCGDSAGGNIATVLSLNSSYDLLPKIKGQILIYPCVDLTLSMKSIQINLEGLVLSGKTMRYFVNHYLENREQQKNWEASPIYAPNFTNQPPSFIFAAGLDPLLDEGKEYKNKLIKGKNFVNYKLYPGQIHGFVTNSKHFPKGLDCLHEVSNSTKILLELN